MLIYLCTAGKSFYFCHLMVSLVSFSSILLKAIVFINSDTLLLYTIYLCCLFTLKIDQTILHR